MEMAGNPILQPRWRRYESFYLGDYVRLPNHDVKWKKIVPIFQGEGRSAKGRQGEDLDEPQTMDANTKR